MARRRFRDEGGQMWQAWEVVPRASEHLQPEFMEGWICFARGEDRRRFARVPEGWEGISPDHLRIMLHAAVPVSQRADA